MAAAGTVDAAGPGCEALLGRRVVGVTAGAQGAYASAALLDGANLQRVPEWLSAAEGIAMYFPYLLSYLALRVRGRVGSGRRRARPRRGRRRRLAPPSSWPRRSGPR